MKSAPRVVPWPVPLLQMRHAGEGGRWPLGRGASRAGLRSRFDDPPRVGDLLDFGQRRHPAESTAVRNKLDPAFVSEACRARRTRSRTHAQRTGDRRLLQFLPRRYLAGKKRGPDSGIRPSLPLRRLFSRGVNRRRHALSSLQDFPCAAGKFFCRGRMMSCCISSESANRQKNVRKNGSKVHILKPMEPRRVVRRAPASTQGIG